MNASLVLLVEVKHDIHLLNHERLKRTPLMCRLLRSFNFFFHLIYVSCCWWLSNHNSLMFNKHHPILLEIPFGDLTRCFGEIYYLIRYIDIEIVNEY